MNVDALVEGFDATVDGCLQWIVDNGQSMFDSLRAILDGTYGAFFWLLTSVPAVAVAALFGIVGWRAIDWKFGLLSGLALLFCTAMGLWPETMSTLALVTTATLLALVVAIPVGMLAGFVPRIDRALEPTLDLIQTLPPYIYLLPAIALLGYGPATALVATFIVAVPPAIRLTSLGIRLTPTQFVELGEASGMTRWQMIAKIRLPFALPSIMAGVNQSLMMAFGMVVIAGIVGSGGLGETIFKAIRTLNIARSIDAAIAIVILTIILDRLTQSATRSRSGGGA